MYEDERKEDKQVDGKRGECVGGRAEKGGKVMMREKKKRNGRMEKGGKGEKMHGEKECKQTSRERREDKKTRRRAGRE